MDVALHRGHGSGEDSHSHMYVSAFPEIVDSGPHDEHNCNEREYRQEVAVPLDVSTLDENARSFLLCGKYRQILLFVNRACKWIFKRLHGPSTKTGAGLAPYRADFSHAAFINLSHRATVWFVAQRSAWLAATCESLRRRVWEAITRTNRAWRTPPPAPSCQRPASGSTPIRGPSRRGRFRVDQIRTSVLC